MKNAVCIWPGVGGAVDPLIKTPFNLKNEVMVGDHRGVHAELLTLAFGGWLLWDTGQQSAICSKGTSYMHFPLEMTWFKGSPPLFFNLVCVRVVFNPI